MNTYIKLLDETTQKYSLLVGMKASSLGEMIKYGENVPPGFVITIKAYQDFIEEINLTENLLHLKKSFIDNDLASIDSLSKAIAEKIIELPLSDSLTREIQESFKKLSAEKVAVRSSATLEDNEFFSMAGQFDTFLNTSESELILNIKKCWASLWSYKVLNYSFRHNISMEELSIAVIIQEMVNSRIAGVTFTIDPVTGDENKIVIEGTLGLGDGVVGGSVLPIRCYLDKALLTIISLENEFPEKVSEVFKAKQNTSNSIENLFIAISTSAKNLAKYFNHEVDIEWAYDGENIFVLQCRSVTKYYDKNKDTNSISLPSIINYEIQFKSKGFSFILADIAMGSYKDLEQVFVWDGDNFIQYIPIVFGKETQEKGLQTFKSASEFENFKTSLDNSLNRLQQYIEQLNQFEIFNLQGYFTAAIDAIRWYSKMDWIYTDLAYSEINKDTTLEKNLKELEKIKDPARIRINELFLESDNLLDKILSQLSTKANIDASEMSFFKMEELMQIHSGKDFDRTSFKERKGNYVLAGSSNSVKYLSGSNAKYFIEEWCSKENLLHSNSLSGTIANQGGNRLIEGIAWVIRVDMRDFKKLSDEISLMPNGSILIAETTAPELLSACQKAICIITDLGGMLSHAAIVSRELEIPCIVGTRHATDLIRNGDRLRIDMNQGIINILSP